MTTWYSWSSTKIPHIFEAVSHIGSCWGRKSSKRRCVFLTSIHIVSLFMWVAMLVVLLRVTEVNQQPLNGSKRDWFLLRVPRSLLNSLWFLIIFVTSLVLAIFFLCSYYPNYLLLYVYELCVLLSCCQELEAAMFVNSSSAIRSSSASCNLFFLQDLYIASSIWVSLNDAYGLYWLPGWVMM